MTRCLPYRRMVLESIFLSWACFNACLSLAATLIIYKIYSGGGPGGGPDDDDDGCACCGRAV